MERQQQRVATRGRKVIATIGLLGSTEGERRYIKGLRCYLAKAGKKAYFCYVPPYLSYGFPLAVGLQ